MIPRLKTGQIDLTASDLENQSVAHQLHTLKKKGRLLKIIPVLVTVSHMLSSTVMESYGHTFLRGEHLERKSGARSPIGVGIIK